MQIGSTRRQVSFMVLVLCHSCKMYVEFTLGQTMEQFLSAQQNAFLFMGGLTGEIMVDYVPGHIIDFEDFWNPAKCLKPFSQHRMKLSLF